MKAILVIDFPDDYGDVNDNKAIVTLRNGKLGTSLGIYNVPLKPLPMKKNTDFHQNIVYANGWNDCLKGITDD